MDNTYKPYLDNNNIDTYFWGFGTPFGMYNPTQASMIPFGKFAYSGNGIRIIMKA